MKIAVTVVCALLAAATLGIPIISAIVGKVKLHNALRPVEYYPPRGYSPIDVLIKYYGFRARTHALLNPIMLYWADRGFITIEEDCKRGLKLTKLRNIEPLEHAEKGKRDGADASSLELIQSNFTVEKTLFNMIFSDGDVFYTLAADRSYRKTITEFVDKCKVNANSMQSKLSRKLTIVSYIFAVFAAVAATVIIAVAAGGGGEFAIMIFPLVGMLAFRGIPNGGIGIIKYPFFAVWGGAPFAAALVLVPSWTAPLLAVSVIASALTISVFADRIDIREPYDIDIYGRICAFKTFLVDAEADRIETLVEENPNYYYDVLPYCYILKITDKLKSKFDRIALDGPSWYLGDLRNTLMF